MNRLSKEGGRKKEIENIHLSGRVRVLDGGGSLEAIRKGLDRLQLTSNKRDQGKNARRCSEAIISVEFRTLGDELQHVRCVLEPFFSLIGADQTGRLQCG